MKAKNHTGLRYGMLTVLHKTDKTKYAHPSTVWFCHCDCGNEKELSSVELRSSKSCGCLRQQNLQSFGERRKGKSPAGTLPLGESALQCLLCCYKKSAEKRQYHFSLSKEEFRKLVKSNCHYCGRPPKQIYKDRRRSEGSLIHNGIDRLDNSVGYIVTNCVSCCKTCNRAKDTMTYKEFVSWISSVVTHLELQVSTSNASP